VNDDVVRAPLSDLGIPMPELLTYVLTDCWAKWAITQATLVHAVEVAEDDDHAEQLFNKMIHSGMSATAQIAFAAGAYFMRESMMRP
jgi:hypothetical protein